MTDKYYDDYYSLIEKIHDLESPGICVCPDDARQLFCYKRDRYEHTTFEVGYSMTLAHLIDFYVIANRDLAYKIWELVKKYAETADDFEIVKKIDDIFKIDDMDKIKEMIMPFVNPYCIKWFDE